ncbi:DnaK suppressor protein [Sphingobium herbicidovorans NBRC 16415]|uniref:DnaK suppressor protein n=1 Tax=Sphingobium herbicidovorans (strain ATCC 700291 / DSM 11019 / CCUG 56400 / KCTC 2939 / LMG 18315 / NBRC 16415 / MH) TaxID=1219045 RepID=A0A086P6H6_SPHHM|nr:DnaK suppressor protein [Sphingobium herbicidovorans NBRC 16415]
MAPRCAFDSLFRQDGDGRIAVIDPNSAKSRLEAQLAELERRQKSVADDLSEPLNPDSSEQAVEKEDDASLEAQAALIAREIASVQRALSRIENGTYGECVRCGGAITPQRLEVRPEAALCIACAQKAG